MGKLDKIGLKHKTDKASDHHDYLNFYEKRLRGYESSPFVFFEVGVYFGSSIRMWSEFFQNSTVVGIDTEPRSITDYPSNAAIRVGDASDVTFLSGILKEFGEPTIVIDDGSHRWDHQIITFQYLFPFLRSGGTYVIEDIDTSFGGYGDEFSGYSQISAFEYIVRLARFVTSGGAMGTEQPYDHFIATVGQSVSSIEFFRRTCLIVKK